MTYDRVIENMYNRGFHFLPIDASDKKPGICEGQMIGVTSATRDKAQIALWIANGLRLGCAGGEIEVESPIRKYLVIIDADVKKENGLKTLEELEKEYGALPKTFTITSPSGGKHFYYLCEKRIGSTSDAFRVKFGQPSGIDIKGRNGYVVCPPSEGYTIDDDRGLATLPVDWAMLLDSTVGSYQSLLKREDTWSLPPSPVIPQFNKLKSVRQALEDFGYEKVSRNYYRHPFGATTNQNVIICSKTGLLAQGGEEVSFHYGAHDKINDRRPHDAFDIYRLLKYDGDMNKAIDCIGRELGVNPDETDQKANYMYWADEVTPMGKLELIDRHIKSQDICILAGFSETYKTFWAMDVCFSLATGLPFLNHFPVRQGGFDTVMVLTESRADFQDRREAWLKYRSEESGEDIDELRKKLNRVLAYFHSYDVQSDESLEKFEKAKHQHMLRTGRKVFRPVLWVIDHFSNNFNGDENSNGSVAPYLRELGKKAYSENVAIMMLHHPPKGGEAKARGASCLINNVPVVYSFERQDKKDRKSPVQVNQEKCSYYNAFESYCLTPHTYDLGLDSSRVVPQSRIGLTLSVDFGSTKQKQTKKEQKKSALLDKLSTEYAMSTEQVAKVMGISPTTAQRQLEFLVEDDRVEMEKTGKKMLWRKLEE